MTQPVHTVPITQIILDEEIYPRSGVNPKRVSLFSRNLLEILSCGHPKTLLINRYLADLPVLAISPNDVIILISSSRTPTITW